MYIATGSFIIRGKRNFVQPRSLTLGLTIMFALSEESLSNHVGERKSRLAEEDKERLEAENIRRAKELESPIEEEAELQIVQVGEVKRVKKNWIEGAET